MKKGLLLARNKKEEERPISQSSVSPQIKEARGLYWEDACMFIPERLVITY
jgi:hypothetical protein